MSFDQKFADKVLKKSNIDYSHYSTDFSVLEIKELREYIDTVSQQYDLTPLMVDSNKCANLGFETYEQVEEEKMKARADAIKVMNVVRYSAPLIKLACEKEKTDEKRSKLFVDINQRMVEYAKQVMVLWNLSPEDQNNNWILNVLTRVFAQGFSEDMLLNDQIIEKLAMTIYEVSEQTVETHYDVSYLDNMTNSIRMAIIKSATPIFNAVFTYQFMKPLQVLEKEVDEIIKIIVNRSTLAVSQLAKEMATEKDRVMLFKVILEETSKMFANVWIENGKVFNQKYSNRTKDELDLIRKEKPEGFPVLEYCVKKFIEQHDILINLSKLTGKN